MPHLGAPSGSFAPASVPAVSLAPPYMLAVAVLCSPTHLGSMSQRHHALCAIAVLCRCHLGDTENGLAQRGSLVVRTPCQA